jgi:general secretion pathway protein N
MIGVARQALKSARDGPGKRRLKLLRICLIGLASLLLLAALLLWFLPARWVMPWLQPRLHGLQLQQVSGSLWDGRADQVLGADGGSLGRLQWQLSRRALLGRQALRLSFDGPQLAFSGDLQRHEHGQIVAHGLRMRADAALLDRYLKSPLGQPRGELTLSLDHLRLQGGWPMEMQGQARWQHALMHTGEGDIALGTLLLTAHAHGGVIGATWRDDGHGPLQVRGQLQLSPLGWRLDSILRARHTDLLLQRWLARLGPISPDGSVHIQYRGGLAGSVPAPSPDQDTTKP